jgi:hypothetical protein
MLEEARQPDSIVCQMRFFSNNDYIIFPSLCIHLEELFTVQSRYQHLLQFSKTGSV